MFTDEVQKISADVCLYVHAVGRIKPNYVSLSVLAAVLYDVICRFLAFNVINFSSCPLCLRALSWCGLALLKSKEFFA